MRNLIIAVLCFVSAASWAQEVTSKVTFTKRVAFNDSILIPASAGIGKVLTSNSHGYATWQPASGGGASKAFNGLHTNVDTVLAGGEIIRPTQMLRTVGSQYSGLKFGDNLNGFLSNSTFLSQYDSLIDFYNICGVADLTPVGGSKYSNIFGLISLSHDTQTLLMVGPDSYNLSVKHNGSAQYTFDATHKSVSSTVRSGSNYYGFGADSASAYWKVGTTTINLPTNAGTNGQVLTTDGTNQASWTTVSGGGATPGGNEGSLQVKYNGEFWGSSTLEFDSIYNKLSVGPYNGTPNGLLEVQNINTQGINLQNSGGGGNNFNIVFDEVGPGRIFLPDGFGYAGQFIINQGTGGHTAWMDFQFASLDSVSIYLAGTPPNGRTFYCTDCSGDGLTGRIVSYIAGAWRRLKFD